MKNWSEIRVRVSCKYNVEQLILIELQRRKQTELYNKQ